MPQKKSSVRPNMQQIADAAGVSKSAVSLALKNDPRLPASTRERIQHLAEKMGYQCSPVMATFMSQLRSSRDSDYQAHVAWVEYPGAEHPPKKLQCVRSGAEARANKLGYGLLNLSPDSLSDKPEKLIDDFKERNIRGLIAALPPGQTQKGDELHWLWSNVSCCVVLNHCPTPRLHTVMTDHFQTAKVATEQALALGYTRPALVLDPELDILLQGRYSAGYFSACKQAGWTGLFFHPAFDHEASEAFKKWVNANKPDVILTVHTELLRWLKDAQLSVPEQAGLIHLDLCEDETGWAGMRQQCTQVGSNAADLVIAQIVRAETGPFEHPKTILTSSTWTIGPTVMVKRQAPHEGP